MGRLRQRLVVTVFEEMHLSGHAGAGANGIFEALVDHDREGERFSLIFDLDFDIGFRPLSSGGFDSGRGALDVFAVSDAVAVVHMILLVWLSPQSGAKLLV